MAIGTTESASGAPRPVSLAQLIRQGVFLVALSLTLVFATRVAATVALFIRFAPDQQRYAKATSAAGLSHAGMLDQDNGLQAFLVSKDQSFLQSYSKGQREVADGNLELASVAGGDSTLAVDVRSVESAQQRWIDGWALPALSGADVAGAAIMSEFLTRGKLLFDDYRLYQERLATHITEQQAAAANSGNLLLASASALEAAILVAAGIFAAVRFRRLRRELADPVARLTAALDDLVAGHYDTRVEAAGRVSEFAPISYKTNELGQTLAALSEAARLRAEENADQARRLRQLLEMTRDIAGSLSLRYVLRSIGQSALKLSPYEVVAVWLVEDGRSGLVPVYLNTGPDGQPLGIEPLEMGASLPGLAAKYGQAFQRSGP